MSTTQKLRAAEALCTSSGGLLAPQDIYEAPLDDDGLLHPEDKAHRDAGRLVEVDDREVNDKGEIVEPKPKAVPRGKQEA